MIGLIQVILFDLIKSAGGPDAVTKVKEKANVPLDKEFRMDMNYDDREWQRLLQATCEVLNLSDQQACDAYADFFHKDALVRWPMWYQMAKNSKEFLTRQPAIHNQFATGLSDESERDSINDKQVVEVTGNILRNKYQSPNKLCALYKSLALVIAKHYEDEIEISETKCMHNGDPCCEIQVEWKKLSNE